MKVLLVCKSLPPHLSGGIQTHTWKLSEWLMHLGHSVTLLTAGSMRKGLVVSEKEGRMVIELPYLPGRRMPIAGKWAEEWAFNHAARQWLRRNAQQYDIVHLQGRSGFMAAGRIRNVPVVQTIHGLIGVENRHGKVSRLSDRLHQRWATYWERRALEHVHALIAVSQETLHNIRALSVHSVHKTRIISNGVELPRQSFRPEGYYFLFIGRLCRIKGIYPLVEAMKRLPEHIRLVMIGDGPERAGLEQAIESAGLQARIQLTGALPQDAVFAYLKHAKALVLPSFFETQGIVLLEAAAFGKPVVATAVGGIPEVVDSLETGLLVPPDNPGALAAAISYLETQPEEAARMGENGRRRVQSHFTWEKIARQTEALYSEVLAGWNTSDGAAAPLRAGWSYSSRAPKQAYLLP